jgi:hypothetical protein
MYGAVGSFRQSSIKFSRGSILAAANTEASYIDKLLLISINIIVG